MYISIFTRYEEMCIVKHTDKNALSILRELVELVYVGWEVLVTFSCKDGSYQIYENYYKEESDLLDDIKLELKSNKTSLTSAEIVTGIKLLEYYNRIENGCMN